MPGIFDIKTGAFDSSEATLLHQAYEIALQGLKSTHAADRALTHRLARSIVKVARSEPDCLRNDGSIDPVKLAQRAILRMLQTNTPSLKTPSLAAEPQDRKPGYREHAKQKAEPATPATALPPESPAKVMLRLFERTPFAKL